LLFITIPDSAEINKQIMSVNTNAIMVGLNMKENSVGSGIN
jgi:hypothetical protein